MRKFGICEEKIWPYDESLLNVEPPPQVYEAASLVTVVPLKLPRNIVAMKTCLANQVPFLIGIKLLDSATNEVKKNRGYVSMPNPESAAVATSGTHAVLIVGYDDRTKHFLVRNSWGKDWVQFCKKNNEFTVKFISIYFIFVGCGRIFLYSISIFSRETSY